MSENAQAAALLTCEREFLEALRQRKAELGITYETIDALGDLPANYTGHMLSGRKPMGMLSMWVILQCLGYGIVLREDPAALERAKRHREWRPVKRKRYNLPLVAIARRRNAPWLLDTEKARKIGQKGREKQARKRNARARLSEQNRANALKRWRKPRVTAVTNLRECRALQTCAEA